MSEEGKGRIEFVMCFLSGSDGDPLDMIEASSEVIARLTSAKKGLATSLDKKKSPAKRLAGSATRAILLCSLFVKSH